ncbi:MAG: hypothetical protein LBV17_12735 [Treponema sp.]|jgi:hypothetical protein|nr:hypothetical protein [Treponema sp.]
MKRKLLIAVVLIFTLSISIIFGQSFQENEIDQKYINSRIAQMQTILLDQTNKKFEGFDRIDIKTYVEKGINDKTFIMMFQIENEMTSEIKDYKLFTAQEFLDKKKCYGAYLTALENNGFFFSHISETIIGSFPVGSLVYSKKIGEKWIIVMIIEKENSVELSMF